MTFEEYKQTLSKFDFTVKRGEINHNYIYVTDDEGHPLIGFNGLERGYLDDVNANGKSLNKVPIHDINYLFSNTEKFMKTNFRDKHLDPIYRLVWESADGIDYLVGYNFETGIWKIATDVALKKWDCQYEFTNNELEYIADGDKELLNRLNFLKERI